MSTIFIFAITALEPWMQFGLAGICFGALVLMLGKIMSRLNKREERDSDNNQKLQATLLEEINKRDERFIGLQEKTLKAFGKNFTALSRVSERIEDVEELLVTFKEFLERKCREK